MTKKQRKIDTKKLDRIIRLYHKGISLRDIGQLVGISYEGVRYWLHKYQKVGKK